MSYHIAKLNYLWFDFFEPANTRHSSNKFDSALVQSRVFQVWNKPLFSP